MIGYIAGSLFAESFQAEGITGSLCLLKILTAESFQAEGITESFQAEGIAAEKMKFTEKLKFAEKLDLGKKSNLSPG